MSDLMTERVTQTLVQLRLHTAASALGCSVGHNAGRDREWHYDRAVLV